MDDIDGVAVRHLLPGLRGNRQGAQGRGDQRSGQACKGLQRFPVRERVLERDALP